MTDKKKKRFVVVLPEDIHKRMKEIALKYNLSMGAYFMRIFIPELIKENHIDGKKDE